MIIFLKFLAMWTLGSIALGLIVGPVIHWGLHYELPQPTPQHPFPSGSILGKPEKRAV